jgi:hypothetical protein
MNRKQILSSLFLCGALPCAAQNAARVHHVGAPVAHTIAPARTSAVTVDSLPNAVCTLSVQDDSGATRTMRLYADDQGQVKFHARTEAETDNPARLNLQCETADQVMEHSIELRANAAIAEANAAAARATARARKPGRVRPALVGDPLAPSDEELLSRGYPPRPDPEQSPEAYATWLRVVTTEFTSVDAKTVLTDRAHGIPSPVRLGTLPSTGNSSNWSGFVAYQDPRLYDLNPPKPYDFASAEWHVPSVTGEFFIQDDSSLWVGLDGWGSKDVLQDGTEQQAIGMFVFGAQWTITTYYAWAEFFPLNEQRITNFDVEPGDHMFAQVWMGNAGSKPRLDGAFGVCLIFNLTRGTNTTVYITPPSGTTFTGITAEWIMERPTVNGVLPNLSNYGTASMFNAYAKRSDGTVVDSNGNAYTLNLTMTDSSGNQVSKVSRVNDTAMTFTWLAFN